MPLLHLLFRDISPGGGGNLPMSIPSCLGPNDTPKLTLRACLQILGEGSWEGAQVTLKHPH